MANKPKPHPIDVYPILYERIPPEPQPDPDPWPF